MSHPEENGTSEAHTRAELAALFGLSTTDGLDGFDEPPAGGFPADGHDATEGTPVQLVAPPDAVWARIAQATGVGVDARPEEVRRTAATLTVAELAPDLEEEPEQPVSLGRRVVRTGRRPALRAVREPEPRPAPRSRPETRPQTRSARTRDRRLEPLVTAVAASMLVIGLVAGAATVLAFNRLDREDPAVTAGAVVGTARLAGLADARSAAGDVEVVQTPDGRRLEISVRRLAPADGFYEVWMADSSLKKMVAVGLLSGSSGSFDLPADVDPAGFPTVDVSLEPLDGDPAHSAVSVLRGTLA